MTIRKRANTELLLHEATRLVSEGKRVVIRVKGNSMLPFLRNEKDSVELDKATDLKCGDIVLAFVENRRFVLHRIIKTDGNKVVLMGDGNLKGCELCTIPDIKAKAVKIIKEVKNGTKQIDCTAPAHLKRACLWRKLLPIRRYLLAIYKRIL